MPLFTIHVYKKGGKKATKALAELKELLIHNTQILQDMSEQFNAIKAKLDLQNTAIGEVKKDIDFVKQKLSESEGGLTGAEVAELNTLLDGTTQKLQALDAETDSTGGTGTGGEEGPITPTPDSPALP